MNAAESIHIAELEVFGRVGVTENEREKPQRLVVNISVVASSAFAEMDDDISRTVNYCAVASEAREFVRVNTFHLVETLVAQLADRLLEKFKPRLIELEVRKFVIPGTSHVAVKLTRQRD